jgi:hypothetical protein
MTHEAGETRDLGPGTYLSWDIPVACAAAEVAMGEKAFFLPGKALPTDIAALIGRCNKSVVVFHLAVALHTPDRLSVNYFRIDGFYHSQFLITQFSLSLV